MLIPLAFLDLWTATLAIDWVESLWSITVGDRKRTLALACRSVELLIPLALCDLLAATLAYVFVEKLSGWTF